MLGACSSRAARGAAARPRAARAAPARPARPLRARSIPVPSEDVIADADSARLEAMRACFRMADIDGNGSIDKQELRGILNSVEGGYTYLMAYEGGLPDAKLDAIFEKYDKDGSGDITFDEFQQFVMDGLLLEGTLADYEQAFNAVDDSGNGSIGATELSEMFRQMGQPVSAEKLVDIFMKYDVDSSGQIEFPEFIEMFRDSVLDLATMSAWLAGREGSTLLKPGALEGATPTGSMLDTVEGQVSVIFSEAELDETLQKHSSKLVVLFGGVTWCRPCKGVMKPYERMADLYDQAIFLKLYGNANAQCKRLFTRLKIRSTPSYILFRNCEVVGQGSGASKERLEALLRGHMTPEELAGKAPIYEAAPAP